jgi:hypothetical protein
MLMFSMSRISSDHYLALLERTRSCKFAIFLTFFLALGSLLSCTSSPVSGPGPSPGVIFLDLPKFDNDLEAWLMRKPNTVDVNFYEPISPNHLPERLQKWIHAAEKSGGKIRVNAPPNDPTAKSPLVLASLMGGLWSSLKILDDFRKERIYDAAVNRDVVLVLDRDPNGHVVVKRVTFSMRD